MDRAAFCPAPIFGNPAHENSPACHPDKKNTACVSRSVLFFGIGLQADSNARSFRYHIHQRQRAVMFLPVFQAGIQMGKDRRKHVRIHRSAMLSLPRFGKPAADAFPAKHPQRNVDHKLPCLRSNRNLHPSIVTVTCVPSARSTSTSFPKTPCSAS